MLIVDYIEIAPIKIHDAWKLCNFVNANEPHLKRFFPKTLEQNLTPALSQYFVEQKTKQFEAKEEFLFTLKHKEYRDFLGLVYIKELDWEKKQGEFAYCVDYRWGGKGVATKSVGALSDHAFSESGLETLQIIAHKDNIPSVKVAINNGFNWIKTLEKSFAPPMEDALDMELYELYKHER